MRCPQDCSQGCGLPLITTLIAIFTVLTLFASYSWRMVAGAACPTCGTNLRADAKFCDECGATLSRTGEAAEYKQVTVLFADVVHSMDIAAVVGSERLRELMSELFDRSDEAAYRDLRDRDRARAIELGFEGHIDMAEGMT